jgi:hypothetical protein
MGPAGVEKEFEQKSKSKVSRASEIEERPSLTE